MFDLDPIGAMFLIIAVLWLIAAWHTGVMTADMRARTAPSARISGN